ncbi:MAG: hypothetical protein ACTSRZ_07105 [Promethearchaeota archaeon]
MGLNFYNFIIFAKSILSYFGIMYLVYEVKTDIYLPSILLSLIYIGLFLLSWKIGPRDLWGDRVETDLWQDGIIFAIPLVIFVLLIDLTLIQIIIVIVGGLVSIIVPMLIVGIAT